MPRTEYNDIDANSAFEDYSVAKRQLSDDLKLNAYTQGTLSDKAGAQSTSIDNIVRKKTN